jgi:hypothetical protein
MKKRTQRDKLNLLTIIVAVATCAVAFFVPEIREYFGLEDNSSTVSVPIDRATPTFTPTLTDTPTVTPLAPDTSTSTPIPTASSNHSLTPDIRVFVLHNQQIQRRK